LALLLKIPPRTSIYRHYSVVKPFHFKTINCRSHVPLFKLSFQTRHLGLSSVRFDQSLASDNVSQNLVSSSEMAKEILDGVVNDVIKDRTLIDTPAVLPSENISNNEIASTVTETVVSPEQFASNELVFEIPEKPTPLGLTEMVGEPTFESLGLASWWPSGRIQYFMETLHISLELEWWQVILTTTVCMRLVVFPIVVMAQRNMANFSNFSPKMVRLQVYLANSYKCHLITIYVIRKSLQMLGKEETSMKLLG
jgi:hypothetical protein